MTLLQRINNIANVIEYGFDAGPIVAELRRRALARKEAQQ
jgi:hypothetical protein